MGERRSRIVEGIFIAVVAGIIVYSVTTGQLPKVFGGSDEKNKETVQVIESTPVIITATPTLQTTASPEPITTTRAQEIETPIPTMSPDARRALTLLREQVYWNDISSAPRTIFECPFFPYQYYPIKKEIQNAYFIILDEDSTQFVVSTNIGSYFDGEGYLYHQVGDGSGYCEDIKAKLVNGFSDRYIVEKKAGFNNDSDVWGWTKESVSLVEDDKQISERIQLGIIAGYGGIEKFWCLYCVYDIKDVDYIMNMNGEVGEVIYTFEYDYDTSVILYYSDTRKGTTKTYDLRFDLNGNFVSGEFVR